MEKHFNINIKFFIIFLIILSLFYSGCATTQDILFTNQRIADNAGRLEAQDKALKELKLEDSRVNNDLQDLKKRLADLSTQLQHEHERFETLEANLEDYGQLMDRHSKDNARENEGIKMRLDRLEELSKEVLGGLKAVKESMKKDAIRSENSWEDLDEETFYELAYKTFQKGEFDTAREIFNAFLDKFPKGKLSDNATFWIGECYYRTNQYEQAILEYEKVKENYPSGDKVPSALFKQGLSFLKLNQKDEAEIILKQLIEHYPQSEQAELAKAQLKNLK